MKKILDALPTAHCPLPQAIAHCPLPTELEELFPLKERKG